MIIAGASNMLHDLQFVYFRHMINGIVYQTNNFIFANVD